MELQFHGAAQTVTGSMHLVTVNGKNILLDCGLFQGKRFEAIERNKNLAFDPTQIDHVILSHAHIDHSGNLPLLVKGGFKGNIFCTHATQDLANIMLRDSAHIQEKDAEFATKINAKKGKPPFDPLYVMKDAEACISQFVGLGYERPFFVTPEIQLTFVDAGHILGSAIVILDINDEGTQKRLVYTGDLGRKDLPIIKDPVQISETDYFITESTYGNREHAPIHDMKDEVQRIVSETIAKGGKIIVPAFSVGRTQELVYVLHELVNEGKLPEIPIYVDSPLSVNITEVFRLHTECFDDETRNAFINNHQDPFGFYRLNYVRHVEESRKLNEMIEPCMIISASGMCEAGRILHHLRNNVQNPNNTILVVGYMAENTMGRRIVEKRSKIKIFGEEHPLKATVEIMDGFSAHAGRNELLEYFNGLNKKRLKQVFIVHGEPSSSNALAQGMKDTGFTDVNVPERGQKFIL
ncbi:MBL fold metallo-hydrolase [bacterium]|nr:MBL fold metallo-hydrolase [bacterium]